MIGERDTEGKRGDVKQGYRKGKSEAEMEKLRGTIAEKESDDSPVYSPSFQQTAAHELLSQRKYLLICGSILCL